MAIVSTFPEKRGLNTDDINDIASGEISNGFIQSQFNFSTEETLIGKWIDGKPLYQKVIEQLLQSGDDIDYSIPTGVSNIDTMARIEGYYCAPNGNINPLHTLWIPTPKTAIGGAVQINFRKTENNLLVRPGTGGWFPVNGGYRVRFIIQYTKTTD